MLAGLDRPLLCSSVHVEAGAGELELPEAAVMLDMFEPKGIDFVVDAGVTVCFAASLGSHISCRACGFTGKKVCCSCASRRLGELGLP